MTDKMFDEKGLRARGETDPEKPAARDENADVEGQLRAFEPAEAGEAGRIAAKDEEPDVEGHRLHGFGPDKAAARDEDEDGGEEGLRVR
jgi:hypothetical protein